MNEKQQIIKEYVKAQEKLERLRSRKADPKEIFAAKDEADTLWKNVKQLIPEAYDR